MTITVTGATGFVGSRLLKILQERGDEVLSLSRHAQGPLHWDPVAGPPALEALERSAAVIHLAGEPVAQRWTAQAKDRIRDSRVTGTRNLVQALAALPRKPQVLIAASAVGFYGDRGEEVLPESAAPGSGFLADTCVEWERAAGQAAALGIRVVRLRIGVVLGAGGGALKQMLPPFRAGVGGPLAGGRMWMPWIHLEDLCRLVVHALDTTTLAGAVNAVAPNPLRNRDFTTALAAAVHRPAIFPVPEFALRLLYGEMAQVVLGSQRVVPEAAKSSGFRYSFAEIDRALGEILR